MCFLILEDNSSMSSPKSLHVSDRVITCTNQVDWTNDLLDLTVRSRVVKAFVRESIPFHQESQEVSKM